VKPPPPAEHRYALVYLPRVGDLLADKVKDIRTHVRNMEKLLYNAAAVVTVKRDTKGRFSKK
jgi:hypothetical protein